MKTYSVVLQEDHIEFLGFDHPALTANLPGDEWEICPKSGERYNKSKNKRCHFEAQKALKKLKPIVMKTDSQILINSLRPYHDGNTDYIVSRDGNKIIIDELMERRPVPDEIVQSFDDRTKQGGIFGSNLIFTGYGGPAFYDQFFLQQLKEKPNNEAIDAHD
jgi:hypothetical protein